MRLLDVFGGAQGSGVGYARAGFTVTSLDREPHPRHPMIAEVIVRDAMEALHDADFLAGFDVIHGGPPCQGYSTMNRWRGKTPGADLTPRLIADVREALQAWDGVYVIENVVGASAHMIDPIQLRGGHFGLGVDRPRLFESNVPLTTPPLVRQRAQYGIYGPLDGRRLFTRKDGSEYRAPRTLAEGQAAMGIHWMEWHDLVEAIPPAYTEHIGHQLRAQLLAKPSTLTTVSSVSAPSIPPGLTTHDGNPT